MAMATGGHASGEAVVATVIVLSCVSTFAVAMRLYARCGVAKNAGWDDGLIVISAAFAWATSGVQIWQVDTGMGRHQWDLGVEEAEDNRKALWLSIIVYNIGLTCTKMSILLQYQRIFPQIRFRIANWITMGIVLACVIWRLFSAIFACVPVNAYWDHSIKDKYCLPRAAVSFASAALNMSTDSLIAILPLPLIKKLEIPRRQRLTLMAVFALGAFVCIVSALRLYSLHVFAHTKDRSYNNGMAAIWSNVECNIGIVCSCLPTLRSLFPKIFKNRNSIKGLSGSGWGRRRSESGRTPSSSSMAAASKKVDLERRGKIGYPLMPVPLARLWSADEIELRAGGKIRDVKQGDCDDIVFVQRDVQDSRRASSLADSTRDLVEKGNDIV